MFMNFINNYYSVLPNMNIAVIWSSSEDEHSSVNNEWRGLINTLKQFIGKENDQIKKGMVSLKTAIEDRFETLEKRMEKIAKNQ